MENNKMTVKDLRQGDKDILNMMLDKIENCRVLNKRINATCEEQLKKNFHKNRQLNLIEYLKGK